MNRTRAMAACAAILLAVSVAASSNVVVLFPDANLEVAIRKATGVLSGPIYDIHLAGITSLDLSDRGITSLEGLEYCVGLNSLDVSDNWLESLAPLEYLVRLERLEADRCAIVDIGHLALLQNLRYLSLSENNIEEIADVARLAKLEYLNLSYNPFLCWWTWEDNSVNLDPLRHLTGLRHLYLDCYGLHEGGIEDISPLMGLTNLLDLWLRGHPRLVDLSPLLGIRSIVQFAIGVMQWASINSPNEIQGFCQVLSGFHSLRYLEVYALTLTDIACLSSLQNLEVVRLENCDIESISVLAFLPQLRELYVAWNNIRDISVLANLPQLEKIDLSYNYDLLGIEPLHRLPMLQEVDLTQTSLPFTSEAILEIISDLEARGVRVAY